MQAIIFDMDGVIVDSEPMHIEQDLKILNHFGIDLSEQELEYYIGTTTESMWKDILEKNQGEVTLEDIIDYAIKFKQEALKEAALVPINGIVSLIEEAKRRGMLLAVASSSPKSYINEVLKQCQITHHFKAIVSGDEVEYSKPAPDIFIKAAHLLGISPNQCIVIEDSTHGVAAGKAAGMYVIGYDNVHSKNQEYTKADWVVHDISEIDLKRFE